MREKLRIVAVDQGRWFHSDRKGSQRGGSTHGKPLSTFTADYLPKDRRPWDGKFSFPDETKDSPILLPRFPALISFFAVSALAVEPVLVADLVHGPSSGFSVWNFEDRAFRGTARLGDDLYFAATSDSAGSELFRVRQGKLELVADLEPGTKGSSPSAIVEMGGSLYFSATTTADGAGIWKTDGTTTTLAVTTKNSTRQPDNFFVTKNGKMFFNQGSALFVTDGTQPGTMEFGFSVAPIFAENDGFGPNAIVSGDSLVFLATHGDTLQLWSARTSLHRLASTYAGARISSTGGLRRIGNGFAFCFYRLTSPSPNRMMAWTPGATNLEYVLTSTRDTLEPYRFLRVGDTLGLILVYKDGFYRFDGTTPSWISAKFPDALVSFDPLSHVNVGAELLFHQTDAAVQTTVAITNGSFVTPIFTGDPYLSNFIAQGNVAFFMNGITNNFQPLIHYVKAGTHETGVLWSSPNRANGTPDMALVGVQGNTLYFVSSLDPTVGLELYGLALPKGLVETIPTQAAVQAHAPSFRATSRGILLEAPGPWTIDLYDPRGQLLSRQILTTAGFHPWPICHSGIAIARTRAPDGTMGEERIRLDR